MGTCGTDELMNPLEDFPGRFTYSHHPFRKENDLNQTSMIMFQPLIFRGVEVSSET